MYPMSRPSPQRVVVPLIALVRVNQSRWIAHQALQPLHNVAFHPRLRHLFPPPYAAVRESHATNYFAPPAEDELQRLIITAVWEVTLILCNYTFLSSPKMDLFNSSVKRWDVNIRVDGMNPGHVGRACNYKGALMAQCGGGGKTEHGGPRQRAGWKVRLR